MAFDEIKRLEIFVIKDFNVFNGILKRADLPFFMCNKVSRVA